MDFFVDKGLLNFIEPPPEKLASMEEAQSSKFNIPQLQALVQEFKMLADDEDKILNRKAVEVLLRKAENSRSLGDIGGLPKEWNTFKRNDFEKIIRNLDIYNVGSIDVKVLATSCILLNSLIPSDADIDDIKRSLKEPEVSLECFLNGKCWFEASESAKDRDYSHPFPRVQMIKEVLFDLYAKNGVLNVTKFTKILRAAEIQMLKPGVKTYSDILIAEIKK